MLLTGALVRAEIEVAALSGLRIVRAAAAVIAANKYAAIERTAVER
jgi:hypothetical protein